MTVADLFLVLSLQVTAPAHAPVTADQLSWMAGYWLSCEPGREVSETWSDPRGGLMLGSALTLENGQASFEGARIQTAGSGVAYLAQPGGAPATAFVAIAADDDHVVFENRDNDFPQRIVYQRAGDVLTARIEGHGDDRQQAIDWRFHKAELNARCPT